MKNYFCFTALLVAFIISRSTAQVYVPVATTGYGVDGVAENTTAISTTSGPLDISGYVLYSHYYGTLSGNTTAVGLPDNGTIVSGQRTYQLQDYTTSNALLITAYQMDSLTLVTPQAYTDLSLLSFATQGNAVIDIKIRYTDNTTESFTSISLNDWFTTATNAVYSGFDRALRSTGALANVGSVGNPIMFGTDLSILCANQGKYVQTISVQNNSSALVCIMGLSSNVPTYSITPSPALLCNGNSIALNATGLASYTWQPSGSFTGANSTSVNLSPTVTTTYTLDGDNNGCPTSTMITVNVSSSLPLLSLTGSSQSICLGAPATITASGALSYTLTSLSANGAAFTPTATDVYTVTGENGCGTSSLTTTITVTPLLVSASAINTLVCSGSPATLTASGATSYSWMPGASTQTNYIASPNANTIYTVIGTTGNCIGTNTVAISTKPLPTLTITASNSMICYGDQVTLNVNGNAVAYTWSAGSQTGLSISDSPVHTTVYTVVGTNSVNCEASVQEIVMVNPNPNVTAAALNPLVCAGAEATLVASGATTYTWSSNANGATTTVTSITDETYTVTGSYSTGCNSTAMVLVSIYAPTLGVSGNTAFCQGSNVSINAYGADTYTWTNNNSNSQILTVNPTASTIYTVAGTISDPNTGVSCDASNTLQVSVNSNPAVTATSNRANNTICRGEVALLTGAGASSYTWTGGSSALTTSTINVSPIADQAYLVTGMDTTGCKTSAQITVKVANCTGIQSITVNSDVISVYPNPSHDIVNVVSEESADFVITNELGQPVRALQLNSANSYHTSIEGLSSGIYFLISTSGTTATKKKIVICN